MRNGSFDARRATPSERDDRRPDWIAGPDADERLLDCAEAAALLEVAPAALTTWSRRLSFPHDVGHAGVPCYRRTEIEALRATLNETHSVTGAIHAARQRVEAH